MDSAFGIFNVREIFGQAQQIKTEEELIAATTVVNGLYSSITRGLVETLFTLVDIVLKFKEENPHSRDAKKLQEADFILTTFSEIADRHPSIMIENIPMPACKCCGGQPPIFYMIWDGRYRVLEKIIRGEYGAIDPNAIDREDYGSKSLLQTLIFFGDILADKNGVSLVKILLEKYGNDINYLLPDGNGLIALDYAVLFGDNELIEIIAERTAIQKGGNIVGTHSRDILVQNEIGESKARIVKNTDAIKNFFNGISVNSRKFIPPPRGLMIATRCEKMMERLGSITASPMV